MLPECPSCHKEVKVEPTGKLLGLGIWFDFAGLFNVGVAYCTQCSRTVTWSTSQDKTFLSIVGDADDLWRLTAEERARVDRRLKRCKCGGRFSMNACPRCPHCGEDLSPLLPDDVHYIRFPDSVDGTRVNVWLDEDLKGSPT